MTPENQTPIVQSDREKYHIPSDIIIDDFEKHLSIQDNLRIFFSAKFGTGKSYFLDEFFNMKADQYEVIKLYPINYSTASNNDIFELIKFDILFHLIVKRQESIGSAIQLSELSKLQAYIHQKFTIDGVDSNLSLIKALTSIADGNEIIIKVIPLIIGIYLEEKKKYKENSAKDNLDIADDFMFRINHSFKEYGDDEPITAIIKEALNKLSKTKKTVLLIDDLDRLDPDHIFRILNIFGNHFSSSSGNKFYVNENKFGFDKVIFVGDKNNIESVFHHRYGEKADFEGYFSKYFSKKIYHFSIIDILISNFDRVIINHDLPIYRDNIREIKFISEWMKTLLKHYITQNKVNFREIHKRRNYKRKLVDFDSNLHNSKYGIVQNALLYKMTEYFINFFEEKDTFLKILNISNDFALKFSNSQKDFNWYLLGETVFFLEPEHRINIDNHSLIGTMFTEDHFIELDSFPYKDIYFFSLNTFHKLTTFHPFPNQKIYDIYLNRTDLDNKTNQVSLEEMRISFKKLYVKFINKYF